MGNDSSSGSVATRRQVRLAGEIVGVRATPLALLFYRQAFGSDMTADFVDLIARVAEVVPELGDLKSLSATKLDASKLSIMARAMSTFDPLGLLKLTWAMAKADAYPKPWPGFEEWLAGLEEVDFFSEDLMVAVLEVAADGLFRAGEGRRAAAKPGGRTRKARS